MKPNALYIVLGVGDDARIVTSLGICRVKELCADTPAIIVSSGSSLNKNVTLLRELSSKAVIIAAGSALGALRRHGITPDFTVIMDPPDPLSTHLSVALPAIQLAEYMGANPIILVGLDLSFSDEAFYAWGDPPPTHAAGVSADKPDLRRIDGEYPLVPGYYGGMVRSDAAFSKVRDYIGSHAEAHPGRFINATEGGALIMGMMQMPLSQAISGYVTEKPDVRLAIDRALADVEHDPAPLLLDMWRLVKQAKTELMKWQSFDELFPSIEIAENRVLISRMLRLLTELCSAADKNWSEGYNI